MTAPRDRLIAALDFPDAQAALEEVQRLEGLIQWFKVGLELYLSAGASLVEKLKDQGYSVFLDLKFHDIPNTVAAAVRSVSKLEPEMLTLHASGGPAMMRAAAEAAASLPRTPRLLAVTVLTSMDQAQLTSVGVADAPAGQALKLARLAAECGIGGLVCSPEEAQEMKHALPSSCIVTPGIRPAEAAVGDQKRIATPAAAIHAGADYLVVGRPIFRANDPARAAQAILEEIAGAMGSTK